MKQSLFLVYTFSIVSILCVSTQFGPTQRLNAIADGQDYARWGLPEGAKARLGKGSIHELTYTLDGNHLLVASSIGIWTYDAHTGEERDLFATAMSNEDATAFSPDRRMFASASYDPDNTVELWDLANRQHKAALKGHTSYIESIAFSPDGHTLATGSSDYTVRLWNTDTGTHKATLVGHTRGITSVAFSPDGHTLATGSLDYTVRLWNTDTGTHKTTLVGHTRGITSVAFSPDGQTLAIAGDNGRTEPVPWVQLWNAVTGKQKHTLETKGSISCLAFSPNSRTLVTGGWGELSLWDVDTGEHKAVLTGHLEGVISVVFSPDGRTLTSGSPDELHLWDSGSGAQKGTITGHIQYYWRFGFALSPDGLTLATGTRGKIRLWDTVNMVQKAILYENEWGNGTLAFSPDGKILASEISPYIRLWDIATETHKTTLTTFLGGGVAGSGIYAIAFSPDGRFFANAHTSHDNGRVWLWYTGFTRKSILTGHSDKVSSIAFSPDSRTLATGSFDHTIRLWDTETDTHKITFTGHTDLVECVVFSPDGKTLASASRDGTVRLWDTRSGEHKATYSVSTDVVAFSPDGTIFATNGDLASKSVRLWDVATGSYKATLKGHTSQVMHIVFSPDEKTLVSGSSDGTVLLWDISPATDTMTQLADVNRDGIVNHHDLVFVASHFGQSGMNDADVNRDSVVNIVDLVLVAAALGTGDSAPSAHSETIPTLSAADVQRWLINAQQVDSTTPTFQKGIAILERLLVVLSPQKTVLLPNYPNPFNPETWIPYQLAKPAEVTVRIHAASGVLIRTLVLGYQPAGIYRSRSRAAYWDGKNDVGEQVASGVYFYTLSARQTSMTRRMVIRK